MIEAVSILEEALEDISQSNESEKPLLVYWKIELGENYDGSLL